MIELFLNMKS